MRFTRLLLTPFFPLLFVVAASTNAFGQDMSSAMGAALDRYFRAVPTEELIDQMADGVSQSVPEEQREEFFSLMQNMMNAEFIETVTREAMAATFSVEEITALTDFYESEHGRNVMDKFPQYMQIAMPKIMQEVQRAMKEMDAKQ